MTRMGIEALCPQPGTSKARPGHTKFPYLLHNLTITRPNQVWALDTTYIPMPRGFVYLTAVVDVATRYVLAHKELPTPALQPARFLASAGRRTGGDNSVPLHPCTESTYLSGFRVQTNHATSDAHDGDEFMGGCLGLC